jgi:hypothetical protein
VSRFNVSVGKLQAGKPCPLCGELVTSVEHHRCPPELCIHCGKPRHEHGGGGSCTIFAVREKLGGDLWPADQAWPHFATGPEAEQLQAVEDRLTLLRLKVDNALDHMESVARTGDGIALRDALNAYKDASDAYLAALDDKPKLVRKVQL